jgi:hypothetical protein
MRASHLLHPDEGQVDITLDDDFRVSELAGHIPLARSGPDWNEGWLLKVRQPGDRS